MERLSRLLIALAFLALVGCAAGPRPSDAPSVDPQVQAVKEYRIGVDDKGNEVREGFNVTKLFRYAGMLQTEVKTLEAGDVGVIGGTENFQIGDTIGGEETTPALERVGRAGCRGRRGCRRWGPGFR